MFRITVTRASNKIALIRALRHIGGCSLLKGKEQAETLPQRVKVYGRDGVTVERDELRMDELKEFTALVKDPRYGIEYVVCDMEEEEMMASHGLSAEEWKKLVDAKKWYDFLPEEWKAHVTTLIRHSGPRA